MSSTSTPAGVPSRRAALARALGVTDRPGFVTPIWQSLVTGTVFVAVGLAGFHAPRPHHARLDAVGPARAVAGLRAGLERAQPGGWDVRRVAHRAQGLQHVRSGDSFGVAVLAGRGTLAYAGASGPTVSGTITHVVPAVAARGGVRLEPVDVLPLRDHDAAGLPLFYLTFGVILASYLFAVTSSVVGAGLPPRGHWAGAAILGLGLGLAAALLGRYLTHSLDGPSVPAAFVLLALASLATSSASWLLLRSSRRFGSLVASIVFVVLASASGGVVPGAFLPPGLAVLRPVLPMGAALSGIREVVYFDGADALGAGAVLVAWILAVSAVTAVVHRRASPLGTTRAGSAMAP